MTKTTATAAGILIALSFMTSAHAQKAGEQEITPLRGFETGVFAEGVGKARHIIARDNGDIYVQLNEMNKNGSTVGLRDTNSDGKADQIEYFESHPGTGIDIHNGYLYFSTPKQILRKAFLDEGLIPAGETEVVATGFPEQDQHKSKAFVINPSGDLFVNVGAPSNSCQFDDRVEGSKGQFPCPLLENHAGIWRFSADKTNQDFSADGYKYASGIRNVVALDWNNEVGELYVVQHGRDSLHRLFPKLFTEIVSAELPAEEFLKVTEGFEGAWPYSYWNHIIGERILAPEYNGQGPKHKYPLDAPEPLYGFPAHYAPNDLVFYEGNQFPDVMKHGAFIAFHGSHNRTPFQQLGFQVFFLPMKNGEPVGVSKIFLDGFAGPDVLDKPEDAKYRPMGLAVGPDGALFTVESQTGRIWKTTYKQ